jgi:hypothetical protein
MDGAESRTFPVGLDREFSRRNFLKTAEWATAALAAAGFGGVTLAGRDARAQGAAPYTTYQGLGDAAILSLAYQLELLEGNFYAAGVDSGLFADDFSLSQLAAIRDHEFAHADAIAVVLNSLGAPIPEPALVFPPDATADAATFLTYAATLEPVGIGAYQGAAPALVDKNVLASAISIHNAECQHWNAIKILQGIVPPNNVAFEEALPLDAVLEAAAPFGITA